MLGRLENQTVTLALRGESSKNPGTALSWKYSDQGVVAKRRELKRHGFPLQDPCCEGREEEEGSRVLASVMGVRTSFTAFQDRLMLEKVISQEKNQLLSKERIDIGRPKQ